LQAESTSGLKLAVGADHRGASSARALVERLKAAGHQVEIVGPLSGDTSDYPIPAYRVGHAVAKGTSQRGILICGTGIGMCIAANKIPGVRAAVVSDEMTAEISRTHNDANILCLSADLLGQRLIEKIAEIFLKTEFHGGRHARRLEEIAAIEAGKDPGA
jgi:ribose 5-phosphate isomerase B